MRAQTVALDRILAVEPLAARRIDERAVDVESVLRKAVGRARGCGEVGPAGGEGVGGGVVQAGFPR